MKTKTKEVDKTPLDIRTIKTPRQLADLYRNHSAALENIFVKHLLMFYQILPDEHAPRKQANDAFHKRVVDNIVKTVKQKLPLDTSIILGPELCVALYDFAAAIQAFQIVMPYIKRHNKLFAKERKKALNCIEKLCGSLAIAPNDKKYLIRMKETFMQGADYFPLYFFDVLQDLGYTPGEQMDASRLQQKLDGLYLDLNVRFPANNPADLFLFQTLQIVVHDLLKKKKIKLNSKKRYYIEGSDKNRDAMELTARLINPYLQGAGLKGLPVLSERAIETTLRRNP